jgi:hypothetical protein
MELPQDTLIALGELAAEIVDYGNFLEFMELLRSILS